MKRWIPATCVALLCGAAFGQACEKPQSCGEKTAAAVSLVKADTDCAAKASHCDAKAKHTQAKASVIAASQTKAKSCHSEGQSTAAAIIAASATKDTGCSADKSTCTKSTAALTKVSATDAKACSQADTCTKSTTVITKVAATDAKACSQTSTCSEAAAYQTIAASFQVAKKQEKADCAGCEDGSGECCKDKTSVTTASYTDGPINKTCPMSGKPISDAALVKYNGKTIGFCGEGCATNFNGATAKQQEKVYNTILASQPKRDVVLIEDGPADAAKKTKSDPYTLDTCAVSGGKLGEMGEVITKVVNGREVKFCCGGCPAKYEADPAKYNAKIDAQLIAQQLPFYPAQTCAVAGTPLMVDGKDVGKNVLVNNRLVRVCCDKCAAKLKADPTAFLAKLDKAVIAKQTKDYPLDNCIVMDSSELGAMGEPVKMVSGNRLIKFCCKGCVGKFKADPAAFIAKLDKAWAEKSPAMFKTAKVETAGG